MGRPRLNFWHGLLENTQGTTEETSDTAASDSPTKCTLSHVRKPSIDDCSTTTTAAASSVCSEATTTLSETSLPQHFVSEICLDHDLDSHHNSYSSSNNTLSRQVDFGMVQVRTYEQVIGDHPQCSSGCPLSLGWDYTQEEPQSVVEYEQHRERERSLDDLLLSDEQRHDRLVANEVPEIEIRRCLRRLHRERECSVRCQTKAKAEFFSGCC